MATLKCEAKNVHLQDKFIEFQADKNVNNFDL